MSENSIISAPTTPENANSSIHKAKSTVSNIILNTLSNSISKWFSPSDQNGNLRRKRETESDIELNDMTHGTGASEPPTKRFRSGQNQDEAESQPTTSTRHLYSTRQISSSTPTTVTPTRRKMLVRNSSPFNFSEQMPTDTRRQSQIEPTTITLDDNGDNSTDEEVTIHDDVTDSLSRELANRKRLNIPPTARPASRTSNLMSMSMRSSLTSRNRFSANHTIGNDATKDDDLEQDALFNGTPNESASESEDSSSRITFTQPNRFATKRPQSSAGRINTSFVRDEEPDQNQRRLSGLFGTGSKRLRGTNGLMNFSAHLQSNKSLFSDKNMPKSLNNSTTSLNSLNRRQSLNASLYGSTSALSDSRLINTNSPFYSGRTMFGGASGYSRRAISSQPTLRVPTQIRPSSSLSTLYSSTNSLANVDPNTSALSDTAKRILDLMNQCTTPLADVKKMASNTANHTPALVNHRKRFDDNDMMLNRSMRLSTPKTPYSRPGANSARKSPPTNELQVPTMSQLLQMKKILQNNTEKVREVATASSSVLNQTGEYKLPESNDVESASTRQSKIRNKITTTRASTKSNVQEEYVQEVNLPNISLPAMKSLPDITLPFSKPITSTYNVPPATVTQPAPTLVNSTITKSVQPASPKVDNSTRTEKSQFSFASPTQLKLPLFDKNIDPINNFKFSEPINVEKATNNSKPLPAFGTTVPSSGLFNVKTSAVDSGKTVAPLKNASVLEALNLPKPANVASTPAAPASVTAVPPQKSLSDLFKSSSKQWECSCCMIKNDNAKEICVACETPRSQASAAPKPIEQTLSAPLTNSFGSQFKTNANTWECSTCMIRNKLEAQKCIACETPKSGGGLEKSVSALPKLAVPSTDQGFKSIVAQQSARWECSACMTRNDANRKKCECCEQAKPGTSSESSIAFSFGSASSSTPKFSFGVPFNEKAASTVVPISEAKSKVDEPKPSFSFGAQPNASVTDGPAKTFSFGSQSKEKDKEKKSDPPATTFSFGVKPTNKSNDNDLSASAKIASTPALSGFKFGASIPEVKPVTAVTAVIPSNKQTTEETAKETRSNELIIGSQNKNAVISVPLPVVPVVPANLASTTNSTISFGSLKTDQKLPSFGAPISKVDSPASLMQTKPTFGLTTTISSSNAQPSTANTSIVNTVTPASTVAPVFAFGQTQNAAKGGFSFAPKPVVSDKQAFPMPDFAQSQVKPAATTTLSFGSSAATVTTAAPSAPFGNSFFFGQAATASTSENSTASSTFGSTTSTPATGFNFGSSSTPAQPVSTTFGTPQQPQLPSTPAFSAAATAITSSLPTEPATSPFMFRSATNAEPMPAFGQSTTPSFGQTNTTPVTPFGSFGSQAATPAPAFSANVNPIGNPITNNAASTTFGSSSPFGSTVNATQTPNFGIGNNGLSNSFGVPPSFGSPSSGFGSLIHPAPANSDEPSAKKRSPGFGALSSANTQPPAFSFGDSSSGSAPKSSFAFNATASPSFNFSGSQPAQTNSSQPYKFGSATAAPAPVFNFGSAETASSSIKFSSHPAASKNTRPSNNTAINSKHIWIRNEDHNLNYNKNSKIHSAAISPNNTVQRKKQHNHFAIKYDPAFDKFHRSKYKIVNVKSASVVANNNQCEQSNTELTHNVTTSPMVCAYDINKTNFNCNDTSKFKYVKNNNLMDVQSHDK
ncbi:nuclear pore complex protein Nup153 isoform X2 [Bradysia coprophila]|uniref:nuclear pore complex protein Nup153 isoform X2 n=1 Tax=Bradysia coprophila TaxID=38358 RepID=UPI00187D735F|nr:nuclear pore complex protein Nup153 isoform X2 [Bradysia coprophila]